MLSYSCDIYYSINISKSRNYKAIYKFNSSYVAKPQTCQIIEALSSELNLSSRKATGIVNTILDSMTNELVNGGNVEIRGFGSFTVREYESYEGKNPKTGKKVYVKAKKLPFFKVGKLLREAVDAGVIKKS